MLVVDDGVLNAGANGDTLAQISNLGSSGTTVNVGAFTGVSGAGLYLSGGELVAGTGTLATATTLKIAGAPTIGTTNRALWVAAGTSEFDGNIGLSITDAPQNSISLANAKWIAWKSSGSSGTEGLGIRGNASVLEFYTGATALTIGSGLQIGAPTGGDKGAGTLNVATGIYLNGTAYTNPDYVFEQWATGKVVKYAKNVGASIYKPMTLVETEAYAKKNWHLPGFGQKAGLDFLGGSEVLLARVEESYLHLFDHEHRLEALEAKLRKLNH